MEEWKRQGMENRDRLSYYYHVIYHLLPLYGLCTNSAVRQNNTLIRTHNTKQTLQRNYINIILHTE